MDKWENFYLNQKIITSLNHLNFLEPTAIQEKVLVYLKAETDLIIQARTGEGKTLCYGLPIINYLFNLYDNTSESNHSISPVGLILVPTRELGVQVRNHLMQILLDKEKNDGRSTYHNIKIVNILGGFAKEKQLKILKKYSPEIIIATPGRLWEIIDNNEASIVSKLHNLQFLVLDEADRMMEKGHFKELKKIMALVYDRKDHLVNEKKISKKELYMNKIKGFGKSDETREENDKIKKMLKDKNIEYDDVEIEEFDPLDLFEGVGADQMKFEKNLKMIENLNNDDEEKEVKEDQITKENEDETNQNDENYPEEQIEQEEGEGEKDNEEEEEEEEEEEDIKEVCQKRKMQLNLRTFLCSATIEKIDLKKLKENKKQKSEKNPEEKQDKIKLESLIKFVHFYNKLIFVKLSSDEISTDDPSSHQNNQINILPERLELEAFKCESLLKDYYLYHILIKNPTKSMIIFTNSISHTKKLKSILSLLQFKVNALHSKMLQSQRIKNLERFASSKSVKDRKGDSYNILICTDVGARGLDIPYVDLVIHYHIPKSIELFVHRSGRTARALKEGTCISLVSEGEINFFNKIMKTMKKEMILKTIPIVELEKYKSLFDESKKLENEEYKLKKRSREVQWFEKKAKECDIDLDDENEEYVQKNKPDSSLLNKKRNKVKHATIHQKKVFQNILSTNIRGTSFLNPYLVSKLNNVLSSNPGLKTANLSEVLRSAKEDSKSVKLKPVKKKYIHRRKNKKIRH